MRSVLRIIDANGNRAREAMRVMEEAARFILDDASLAEPLKQMRHDLVATLAGIDGLAAARDTPGDVGTALSTPTEQTRSTVADVAAAAGNRLSEALRSIEEYAKTVDPQVAATIEKLRYRGYDIEQSLNRALTAGRAKQWRLCVLISEVLCPDRNWLSVARAAIDGGADCLQLREKTIDASELLRRAAAMVALARPAGVDVIINDRPDIARISGAAGVHLGQTDLPCREVRSFIGHELLIGVSTSCLDEAEQALRDGADYCGVGPMFATTTKHKDVIVGPAYLREFLSWGRLPHLAIGGISSENVSPLKDAGALGIAVSSAICAAADPEAATSALIRALN